MKTMIQAVAVTLIAASAAHAQAAVRWKVSDGATGIRTAGSQGPHRLGMSYLRQFA